MTDLPTSPEVNAPRPVARWHLLRRLYNWVLGLAERKHSTTWLAGLAFAESSFFPVPPDVLLIPLVMGARRKAIRFATVCTVASVIGGLFGYLIGLGPLRFLMDWLASIYHFEGDLRWMLEQLNKYGFLFVFLAGLTPIPYKVFTIAAGISQMNVVVFVLASFIGRGARFYGVSALLRAYGEPIKRWIDKYFNLACILFAAALVGGFYAIKYIKLAMQ